jgi:hypothetical protein
MYGKSPCTHTHTYIHIHTHELTHASGQIKFLEVCVKRLKTAVASGGEEELVDALEELEDQVRA